MKKAHEGQSLVEVGVLILLVALAVAVILLVLAET